MKFETVTDAPPGRLESTTRGDRARRPRGWLALGYGVATILALGPVARMTRLVLEGSLLQYNDYWQMLPRFTNSDGGLDVAGLFHFQNHPVVVPQLLYWFNIKLFSGSNVTLGLLVVGLALGILAMVALILWRSDLRPVHQMAVFVLASCLLFTPNGAWNYSKAMSGTAWLSAGLFTVLAVYLRSRDRTVLAFALAILAAVSYGTGLMVWPAVAAVGACRRPVRQWWREWPYLVGFVVTYTWYRQEQADDPTSSVPWPGLENTLRATARMLILPLGLDGSRAEWLGFVVIFGILALVVWSALVSRAATAAPWTGIAVFGLLATVELVIGRYEALTFFTEPNRYVSVPALAWIGFAGLLLSWMSDLAERSATGGPGGRAVSSGLSWVTLMALAGVAVLAATSGSAHLDQLRRARSDQELREVALRLGIADDTFYLTGPFGEQVTVTDLLITTGHQPFVDSWDLDCGLIDGRLEAGPPDAGMPTGEVLSGQRLTLLRGAVEITGRIASEQQIRCVVVTNEAGEVVGAATVGVDGIPETGGDSGATGFTAIARPGFDVYRTYVIFDDDPTPVPLGNLSVDEIEPQ